MFSITNNGGKVILTKSIITPGPLLENNKGLLMLEKNAEIVDFCLSIPQSRFTASPVAAIGDTARKHKKQKTDETD